MDWKKEIREKLSQIPLNRTGEFQWAGENLRVSLKLADWDRLGCLLNRLEIVPTSRSSPAWKPAKIEERITYLGEKLKTIEVDSHKGKTILRSAPPQKEEERVSFFEIDLDSTGGLSFVRYTYDFQREERLPIPAALSRTSLERLLADLIELARAN